MASWLTQKPFAHRGLHGPRSGHIENSLSAFHAAIKEGFGFELDVLLSKDNKAIVIHDEDLKRLTGQSAKVSLCTADELSNKTLIHSSDHIPSLSQVLNMTKGRSPILIEIKGDQGKYTEIAKAVYQDIKDYKAEIAVMSFYPEIIEYFNNNHPDVIRGLVATPHADDELPTDYFDQDFQIKTIKDLDVAFIAYDIRALPNKVTEHCKENDIPVLIWTVRTDHERQKTDIHADNIIFEAI